MNNQGRAAAEVMKSPFKTKMDILLWGDGGNIVFKNIVFKSWKTLNEWGKLFLMQQNFRMRDHRRQVSLDQLFSSTQDMFLVSSFIFISFNTVEFSESWKIVFLTATHAEVGRSLGKGGMGMRSEVQWKTYKSIRFLVSKEREKK